MKGSYNFEMNFLIILSGATHKMPYRAEIKQIGQKLNKWKREVKEGVKGGVKKDK